MILNSFLTKWMKLTHQAEARASFLDLLKNVNEVAPYFINGLFTKHAELRVVNSFFRCLHDLLRQSFWGGTRQQVILKQSCCDYLLCYFSPPNSWKMQTYHLFPPSCEPHDRYCQELSCWVYRLLEQGVRTPAGTVRAIWSGSSKWIC